MQFPSSSGSRVINDYTQSSIYQHGIVSENTHGKVETNTSAAEEDANEFHDLVLSMRAVDAKNKSLSSPLYGVFLLYCDLCGVSARSCSITSLIHSASITFADYIPIDNKHSTIFATLRLCYRVLLWLALLFVTTVDIFDSINQGAGAYVRTTIALLMFMSCSSSLILANDIIKAGTIRTRASQNMALSPSPALYRQVFNAHILTALAASISVAAIGFAADFLDSASFLADTSTVVGAALGSRGIYLYRMASVLMQLQIAVGVAVISLLLMVLKDRVRLAHRCMAMDDNTTVENAIRRLIDLDITLSHAAHKFSGNTVLILLGFMLKFLLCAFYHVSENNKTGFVGSAQPGRTELLDMIVQPGAVCIYLLIMLGSLNQQVEYLVKICARFTLRQRSKPRHDKKLVRDLQTYSKNGDFYFRIYGFAVTLSTVWKTLAVCVSTYILLLRFKRWGII